MFFCFYLFDGWVVFMFWRVVIDNNDVFNVGGMVFDVIKFFCILWVIYIGEVCVLVDLQVMENLKQVFVDNFYVYVKLDLIFQGFILVYGGEVVDNNGKLIEEVLDEVFVCGYYEQYMCGNGQVGIGDEQFDFNGFGLCDYFWGLCYWQNLYWYCWLLMVFSDQLVINIFIVIMVSGCQYIWGMVYDCCNGGF